MVRFVNFDAKRKVFLADNHEEFLYLAAADWITEARQAVRERDAFYVALSGGQTPLGIFKKIYDEKEFLPDPGKIFLFWSDERDVDCEDPDSNYRNAMDILGTLKIPENNIFKMRTHDNAEESAYAYERIILEKIPESKFDLVMLGLGTDGHTASLFPETEALKETERLVTANFVPKLNAKRITMTFPCITSSREVIVYVSGLDKKNMVDSLFKRSSEPLYLPINLLSSSERQIKWFIDSGAYSESTFN